MRRHNKIKNNNKTEELTKAFVEEILRFNKAHNIVGRFTKDEINLLDILDCESILAHIPPAKKILDIGSGAGLPGIIIAIIPSKIIPPPIPRTADIADVIKAEIIRIIS